MCVRGGVEVLVEPTAPEGVVLAEPSDYPRALPVVPVSDAL
jgi:hypothetical protein